MQHHGLDGDSRSKRHHDSPLRRLAFLLVGRLTQTAAQLIEHEDHRCATHVAELAEHMATGRQLAVVQAERSLDVVQDGTAARMDRPEEVVPIGIMDAKRAKRIDQAAFDVASQQPGNLVGDVVLHAALVDLHGDGILGFRYRGLRGEGHLEQRALHGADGVGADDDGTGAVAEQSLAKDVVGAAAFRPVEGDERDLGARHEDARATVVLRELLGELERPAPAVAAVARGG